MWLGWIVASCVVLSAYDLCKKASVRGNAVFPTLLGSTLAGWLAVSAFHLSRGTLCEAIFIPPPQIGLLLAKSVIVGASWTATYLALRTFPITSAAPIRATGPFWTLLGAMAIFAEIPTPMQGVGMICVIVGCVFFSLAPSSGNHPVWRERAVSLALLGTLLGSCSALYDKCLLQRLGIPTGTVLWWFLGGMCVIYAVACAFSHKGFVWRWTIPCVGILLAVSDACYFNAISSPDSRVSVLSMIRRSSVVLTFLVGGAIFHETNLRRKALSLAAILLGVLLLCIFG